MTTTSIHLRDTVISFFRYVIFPVARTHSVVAFDGSQFNTRLNFGTISRSREIPFDDINELLSTTDVSRSIGGAFSLHRFERGIYFAVLSGNVASVTPSFKAADFKVKPYEGFIAEPEPKSNAPTKLGKTELAAKVTEARKFARQHKIDQRFTVPQLVDEMGMVWASLAKGDRVSFGLMFAKLKHEAIDGYVIVSTSERDGPHMIYACQPQKPQPVWPHPDPVDANSGQTVPVSS